MSLAAADLASTLPSDAAAGSQGDGKISANGIGNVETQNLGVFSVSGAASTGVTGDMIGAVETPTISMLDVGDNKFIGLQVDTPAMGSLDVDMMAGSHAYSEVMYEDDMVFEEEEEDEEPFRPLMPDAYLESWRENESSMPCSLKQVGMLWDPKIPARPGVLATQHIAPSVLLKGMEGINQMSLVAMDEGELIKKLRKENGLSGDPVKLEPKDEEQMKNQLWRMDQLFLENELRIDSLDQELYTARTQVANLHKMQMKGKKRKLDEENKPHALQWTGQPGTMPNTMQGATPGMPGTMPYYVPRPGVPGMPNTYMAAGGVPRPYAPPTSGVTVPGSTPVTSTGLATGAPMHPMAPGHFAGYNLALMRPPVPGVLQTKAQIDANARLAAAQAMMAAAQSHLLATQAAQKKALATHTAAKAKADAMKDAQKKAAAAAAMVQAKLAANPPQVTAPAAVVGQAMAGAAAPSMTPATAMPANGVPGEPVSGAAGTGGTAPGQPVAAAMATNTGVMPGTVAMPQRAMPVQGMVPVNAVARAAPVAAPTTSAVAALPTGKPRQPVMQPSALAALTALSTVVAAPPTIAAVPPMMQRPPVAMAPVMTAGAQVPVAQTAAQAFLASRMPAVRGPVPAARGPVPAVRGPVPAVREAVPAVRGPVSAAQAPAPVAPAVAALSIEVPATAKKGENARAPKVPRSPKTEPPPGKPAKAGAQKSTRASRSKSK